MKKVFLLILVLSILLTGCGKKEANDKSDNKTEEYVFILDINPSMKIILNKNNEVKKIEALNEDAKNYIVEDYTGKSVDLVMDNIISNLVHDKIIDNNSIILLTANNNKIIDTVTNGINSAISKNELKVNLKIQKTDKDLDKDSIKDGISIGKMLYIEEIVSKNNEYSIDDLKNKSLADLNKIKDKKNDLEEEKTTTTKNKTSKTTTKTTKTTTKKIVLSEIYNNKGCAGAEFKFPKEKAIEKAKELATINNGSNYLKYEVKLVDDEIYGYKICCYNVIFDYGTFITEISYQTETGEFKKYSEGDKPTTTTKETTIPTQSQIKTSSSAVN